ncbi:MAG: SNF2-related protein [Desulfotomaculales bacterium]
MAYFEERQVEMATRRIFGKTWWGNAWVEAMERIDYNTNRLPRGRRYAREGMVKEIEVVNGEVLARVKGSRPTPYRVRISLKKFGRQQKEKIKAIIAENPALASQLSLGKLPEEMLAVLARQHIHLLPASWKELTASCSCPDWANPCKHLAAVYYLLANEIDKDPFIIFALRGMDTGELTEAAGFSTGDTKKDAFVPYTELAVPAGEQTPWVEPDLTFENATKEALSALLTGSPLFYPAGDFKKYLLKAYRNVARALKELPLIEDSISFANISFCLLYPSNACFALSDVNFFAFPGGRLPDFLTGKKSNRKIPYEIDGRLALKKTSGELIGADRLLEIFIRLPLNPTLDGNSPSARFLNVAVAVAHALAREAAYLPEVVSNPDGAFSVRYIPLLNSEKINDAIECLAKIVPVCFVFREKDKAVLTGRDAVLEVLSLILSYLVRRFSGIEQEDKLCDTFFKGRYYAAARFEEKQTAKAVSDWLARLHAQAGDISPVIRIEPPEKGDRFKLQVEVENKKDPLAAPLPLAGIFRCAGQIFSRPAEEVRSEVARQITLAAEYLPGLKDILNSKGRNSLFITPLEMADFLERGQEILNFLGIKVVIPKELKRLSAARVAIRAEYNGNQVSYLSLEKVLRFSWEVALGETTLTRDEFLRLAGAATGLVRFKDQYLLLKPEEVRNVLEWLNRPLPRPSSTELLQASLTGELQDTAFNPDEAFKRVLDELTRVERPAVPRGLKADLRPYQKRGYRWLYTNAVRGLGCCLADDMGLGKTIQIIALILKLKEENQLDSPALVICPTTLVGNWTKECGRFAPSLNVAVYYGAERRLSTSGIDVLITTYGVLRRDLGKFKNREWSLVVVDEAQNIKNPGSEQTRAVKSLPAKVRLAASGTPVENRLTELWSIFDFINRGYLGSLPDFTRRFAVPIEKYRDREKISRLKRATAPFILRRLKTDRSVIKDLPDKVITNEYCHLTKEQAALYQQVVDAAMREIEKSDGIKRKGLIFRLITSLKQICNHPAHYTRKGNVAKELSGKAEKTVELVKKIILAGEKVLIFTQYREMGELLVEMIGGELKEDVLFFHGGLPRTKRDRLVEEFQGGDRHPVLVVSLKAGGTGLNLTAAANVIHYDLWWNPAVEAQATDRTYRIGQTKKVIVYRLITLGTFEEKIDEMLGAKKELAELTVAAGEQWITELSDRELLEIFRYAAGLEAV